jgi:release factor glutamine methyltransferase
VKVAGASVSARRVRDLLASTTNALGSASEARWIVAHAAGVSAGDLGGRLDVALSPAVWDAARAMQERCLSGEPLQYVLGSWAFRGLELHVDGRALIPRPETEQVVDAALDELRAQAAHDPEGSTLVAVDLGTGSGAIALSLASEFAVSGVALQVWATDSSADALDLFSENLAALAERQATSAGRVRVSLGSWFDALPTDLVGTLRLVVSNPPYVSQAEWEMLEAVVHDHEPVGALVPGPTGMEAIEVVLLEATRWLAPGGSLVVELAPGQARQVTKRATELGYESPDVRPDLVGRPRMLVTRAPRR